MLSANVNPVMNLDYRKRFYSGALNIKTSFTHESDFDGDGNRFGEEKFRLVRFHLVSKQPISDHCPTVLGQYVGDCGAKIGQIPSNLTAR